MIRRRSGRWRRCCHLSANWTGTHQFQTVASKIRRDLRQRFRPLDHGQDFLVQGFVAGGFLQAEGQDVAFGIHREAQHRRALLTPPL